MRWLCPFGVPLLLAQGVIACGAHVTPAAHQRTLLRAQRCAPADPVVVGPGEITRPQPAPRQMPPDVARTFSAGRLPPLGDRDDDWRSVTTVLTHLMVLKSELAAAEAYVDCLGDSLEDLHRELLDRRNQNELYLTLASIGVGAAAATAQGILEVRDPDTRVAPVVGIAGGTTAAALGATALLWPSPTIWLDHEVNVLRSIWTGEDSGGLPAFVWRLLLTPRPGSTAPRVTLRSQWDSMLREEPDARRRELELLLFGSGGRYDLDAIQLRETMLDHLETEVDLMNQEFQALAEFVALRYAGGREE